MKIGLINHGAGNIGSIYAAIQGLGSHVFVVEKAVDLHLADAIILPGVGNFSECMCVLKRDGWVETIQQEVGEYKKPLLGICLGMQILACWGEEGTPVGSEIKTPGLGFIPGEVRHIRELGCSKKLPHVGWNDIIIKDNGDKLLNDIPSGTDFYFVHSYTFIPDFDEDIVATTDYELRLTAVVRRHNVWGTQFHPEKSSRAGLKLLKNFLTIKL